MLICYAMCIIFFLKKRKKKKRKRNHNYGMTRNHIIFSRKHEELLFHNIINIQLFTIRPKYKSYQNRFAGGKYWVPKLRFSADISPIRR